MVTRAARETTRVTRTLAQAAQAQPGAQAAPVWQAHSAPQLQSVPQAQVVVRSSATTLVVVEIEFASETMAQVFMVCSPWVQ